MSLDDKTRMIRILTFWILIFFISFDQPGPVPYKDDKNNCHSEDYRNDEFAIVQSPVLRLDGWCKIT